MMTNVGNVVGARGCENGLKYEILGVDYDVRSGGRVHVRLERNGVQWEVESDSDDSDSWLLRLRRNGEEMPYNEWSDSHRPNWVPDWTEEYADRSHNSVLPTIWYMVICAITDICQAQGREFDSDPYSFRILKGEVWVA